MIRNQLKKIFRELKTGTFCLLVISACLFMAPALRQEIQEKVTAINIEVPVRVFDGDIFVGNLTKDDFELYEDDVAQEILASYFVSKTTKEIKREGGEEALSIPNPDTSRKFILIFEMNEFERKCGEALSYVIENVLDRNDTLVVATPLKTYNLDRDILAKADKKALSAQLKEKLLEDIQEASAELRFLINDYMTIADDDSGVVGREDALREILSRISRLKTLEQDRLILLARVFARLEGQKHIFLFYQKDDVLIKRALNAEATFEELFKMELMRDVNFDINRISQMFAQTSLTFHFIFITGSKTLETSFDRMQTNFATYEKHDISGAFFSAFRKIAEATGGMTVSSQNILASLKKTVEVSDQYYLLYYRPRNVMADGRFKRIKVRVKDKDYKILHRAGYFATGEDLPDQPR